MVPADISRKSEKGAGRGSRSSLRGARIAMRCFDFITIESARTFQRAAALKTADTPHSSAVIGAAIGAQGFAFAP